jgi:hypothetical protein
MVVLQWTAIVAGTVAAVVSFAWYAKGRNKGHFLMGCCFAVMAAAILWARWVR